ncbi:unnamed protein product [Gadus morhua 'NCC']
MLSAGRDTTGAGEERWTKVLMATEGSVRVVGGLSRPGPGWLWGPKAGQNRSRMLRSGAEGPERQSTGHSAKTTPCSTF